MSLSLQQLELRPIQPDDNLSKLSLGNPSYSPLKIFLKKIAFDFHQYDIAKTYVLTDTDIRSKRVWGYLTLMSSEIVLNKQQKPQEISTLARYEAFPAVKIARLAVDKSLQGKGYGQMIMQWSASLVRKKIMPHIGCRFLVVDAKRDAAPFYEKIGFELLDITSNINNKTPLMFFDIYRNRPVQ
jgi:GNAT superfamily N-acetyltransferase